MWIVEHSRTVGSDELTAPLWRRRKSDSALFSGEGLMTLSGKEVDLRFDRSTALIAGFCCFSAYWSQIQAESADVG